jgi:omega-hydroxy-beta-dihydromenaquinone-9 sulfotransferase
LNSATGMPVNHRKLIFITGASRSGTTLLSFMLRRHPAVFGLKELQFFGRAWDPRDFDRRFSRAEAVEAVTAMRVFQERGILTHEFHPRDRRDAQLLVDSLPDGGADPARLFATIAHQFAADAGKQVPCEQTPRYIFYAEALLDIYPEARVVHLVRDPRAVMASQKMRWRRRQLSPAGARVPLYDSLRVWVNYHPYTIASLWSRATAAAVALADHPRVTLVRFEDLLREPDPTMRGICGRLEIEYDAGMLEVGQVNSSHRSSSSGARVGLRVEAISKWREVLTHAEVQIADHSCAPFMQRFGYEPVEQGRVSLVRKAAYGLSYLAHLGGVLLVNPSRAYVQSRALMRLHRRHPADPKRRRTATAPSQVVE